LAGYTKFAGVPIGTGVWPNFPRNIFGIHHNSAGWIITFGYISDSVNDGMKAIIRSIRFISLYDQWPEGTNVAELSCTLVCYIVNGRDGVRVASALVFNQAVYS